MSEPLAKRQRLEPGEAVEGAEAETHAQASTSRPRQGLVSTGPTSTTVVDRRRSLQAPQRMSRLPDGGWARLSMPERPPSTVESIEKDLLRVVRQRMQDVGRDPGEVSDSALESVINAQPATLETLELLKQGRHMLVSDDELQRALKITPASGQPTTGVRQYYMRSYTFSKDEFRVVVDKMDSLCDYRPETLQVWFDLLELYDKVASVTHLVVRYVGSVTPPRTPWDRVEEDANRSGFHGRFLRAVDTTPVVWSFASAFGPSTKEALSLREDVLVQVFGLSTLLNQVPGGELDNYLPSIEDIHSPPVHYPFFRVMKSAALPWEDDPIHAALTSLFKTCALLPTNSPGSRRLPRIH